MKVSTSTAQNIAQEELKNKNAQKVAAKAAQDSKKTQDSKGVDSSSVKSNPLAQNIKNINTNIGKLQVAQKSLESIESDSKKYNQLAQDLKETFEKDEQDDIKEQMRDLRKNIESTLKNATFEGGNVFAKAFKDSKDKMLFDAPKINTQLLDSDSQKFYDTLKEAQSQIKNAISTLQNEAESNSSKLASSAPSSSKASKETQDTESTNGSFLSKLGSLFRVSHDTSKLSNDRVRELLS